MIKKDGERRTEMANTEAWGIVYNAETPFPLNENRTGVK